MSEGDNHTHFNVKKGMGLVSNIFNEEAIKKLKGNKKIHL
jgi:amidophosphoribosyltransferase